MIRVTPLGSKGLIVTDGYRHVIRDDNCLEKQNGKTVFVWAHKYSSAVNEAINEELAIWSAENDAI